MRDVLSREQVRALDAHAIDVCKVPGIVLMENAGRGAADFIDARLPRGGTACIVCGGGNNGGDGFVVARQLVLRGRSVRVFFATNRQKLTGDAATNHDAFVGIGGVIEPVSETSLAAFDESRQTAAVVVDGLLGTGLDRQIAGFFRTLIERINGAPCRVIALDVPSGLDANTGRPLGIAVRARETVTFAALKLGLLTSSGAALSGDVSVVDIGVPPSLVRAVGVSARVLEATDVAGFVQRRSVAAHKGSAGRIVAIAGSEGKTGAALLVARGALRAGAGTCTIATFPAAADALDHRVLEEMTARLDPDDLEASVDRALEHADAVVLGPGLGTDERAKRVAMHVALKHAGPVVIDADALTLLADDLGALTKAAGPRVLTPHPGEMARLLQVKTPEVEGDRFAAVLRAARMAGAVVLLKGARTLLARPGELPVVNPTGTPALATAGSGDVLSGIIGALVSSTKDVFEAACAGAYLHGLSAERWAKDTGKDRGLLAHEIADGLPAALAALTGSGRPLPV